MILNVRYVVLYFFVILLLKIAIWFLLVFRWSAQVPKGCIQPYNQPTKRTQKQLSLWGELARCIVTPVPSSKAALTVWVGPGRPPHQQAYHYASNSCKQHLQLFDWWVFKDFIMAFGDFRSFLTLHDFSGLYKYKSHLSWISWEHPRSIFNNLLNKFLIALKSYLHWPKKLRLPQLFQNSSIRSLHCLKLIWKILYQQTLPVVLI